MNIFLINTGFSKKFGRKIIEQGGITIHYNKVYQPLSLGYIASLVINDKEINADLKLVDLNIQENKTLKRAKIDIAVIATGEIYTWQCPNPQLDKVAELVGLIRCKNIILIGPHGTTNPEYVFDKVGKNIILVKGEPELITYNLIKKIYNGESFYNMNGIVYFKNGQIKNNQGLGNFDFNKLPLPAYNIMEMDKYGYDMMPGRFSIIETTRGCPYNCDFCLKIMYGARYSPKSVDKVIEEIKLLVNSYDVKNIFFIDLEFTILRDRVIEICRRILKENLNFKWSIQARVDKVDKALLDLMKKAGCVLIHYGVESGDLSILKKTNKNVNFKQIRTAFRITRKARIKSLAYFTIGHPYETKDQILKTIEFSKELNPDLASFVIMMPYPGTKIYDAIKDKINTYDLSANMLLNKNELEALRSTAVKQFYLRPNYIITQLFSIRSFKDILWLVNGFFNIFLPFIKAR